jgi:hypothetical protein
MRTNFNQTGIWNVVARHAAMFVWLASVCLTASADSPITINLNAGADGRAIQAALDSLPAAGGEVVLPAGTFQVRQPLVLRRDFQTLRGAGAATVLRLADNANCPVIILGEPVNVPANIIKNLCVRDLYVDGNRAHQQRERWREQGEGSEIRNNGITVQAVTDSSVENVTCARNRSGGLVTTLGVQRLTVRDFEAFDNEFDGLACYLTTDSLFTGLNLHHNPGAGISLDLDFNHNVMSNATLTANDLGIFMRASRENRFDDVFIRDSVHHGVFMAHSEIHTPQGPEPVPKTECVDNTFTDLIDVNCGGAAFRVNDITCTNNVLIRPQFDGNREGDLSLARPNLITVQ